MGSKRNRTSFTLIAAVALGALAGWLLIGADFGPSRSPVDSGPGFAAPVVERPRTGGTDVTFLWASDVHVGASGMMPTDDDQWVPIEGLLESMTEQMNTIPGRMYPLQIGGAVAAPLGVIISGDLTESGTADQWERFERHFGLTGSDGRLAYPVYEGIGNHDRHGGSYVAQQVARRHGANVYSWQWGDLHMICLGEGPGDGDLVWLAADLAATGADRPVIVYLHFALAGPFSDSNWFGKGDYPDRMAEILRPYNVIAIFHGHFHGSGRYQWKGFDVYNIGSAKHGWKDFAVVRVTDASLTVAAWNWQAGRWWWLHRKPINGAADTDVKEVSWLQPIPGVRYPPLIPHPLESW